MILEGPWWFLDDFGGVLADLGNLQGELEGILGGLGGILGPFEEILEGLGSILGGLGGFWGEGSWWVLEDFLGGSWGI